MSSNEFKGLSNLELMYLYARLLEELRKRGVTGSFNGPVADYAEKLVAESMGLTLAGRSNTGFDAVDERSGTRYEIKSRRVSAHNRSTQLGALRNLDQDPFDYLIGVIFDANFNILYAAKIPIEIVRELSTYVPHTNSYKLMLRRSLLEHPGVEDVTSSVSA